MLDLKNYLRTHKIFFKTRTETKEGKENKSSLAKELKNIKAKFDKKDLAIFEREYQKLLSYLERMPDLQKKYAREADNINRFIFKRKSDEKKVA